MSYQEKKALFNLLTYFGVLGFYAWYVYQNNWDPTLGTDEMLVFWSKFLLIMIPIQIVSHIVIHILLSIAQGMANGGKLMEDKEDEFDKIIDLKASRVSMALFALGFISALGYLAAGYGVTRFFLTIVIAGAISEVIEAFSRVYMYRRGA